MKKPTCIIGKKQLILSGLTLVLGAAVYLNYVLSGGSGLISADLVKSQPVYDDTAASAEADDLANYGTAEMVSASPSPSTSTIAPLLWRISFMFRFSSVAVPLIQTFVSSTIR